jgi:hypothetical protein
MNKTPIDFIANIKLYDTKEGGRETPTPPNKLGCILEYNGENYDCFLILHNIGSLPPGFRGDVPIALLYPEYVKDKLIVGSKFYLKSYRKIGEGEILKIIS